MNPHYARLENNVLVYAPKTLVAKSGALILNPKRLAYLQAGYKQIVDNPPAAPVGKTAALTRYEETYDTITFVYKFVPIATAPRTFSKLKLVAALQAEGLWSAVHDWLIEADLEDLFLAAQNFREDYPAFTAALNAAKSRFHLTDDQTAALLAASVAD